MVSLRHIFPGQPVRLALLVAVLVISCGRKADAPGSPSVEVPKYIYVATGAAYAGNGITQSTPSKLISKYTSGGVHLGKLRDYNDGSGDSPVALLDYDQDHLLALIENTAARRIVKVAKDGSGREETVLVSGAAFGAVLRHFAPTSDGGFLISATGGLERFNSAKARVTLSGNAYVVNPGDICTNVVTLIPDFTQLPTGEIIIPNAGTGGTLHIFQIAASGYSTTEDCLAEVATPSAEHFPTSILYHRYSGRLFVTYSSDTGPVHEAFVYVATQNRLEEIGLVYDDPSILQSVTALTEMEDGTILAASGGFNSIEKITYVDGLWSRLGTTSFIPTSIETTGVSSIVIGE